MLLFSVLIFASPSSKLCSHFGFDIRPAKLKALLAFHLHLM
jgi:hypothetical protein